MTPKPITVTTRLVNCNTYNRKRRIEEKTKIEVMSKGRLFLDDRQLIQKLHRFSRVSDPGCGRSQACLRSTYEYNYIAGCNSNEGEGLLTNLKIIGTSGQELVANVESTGTVDAAEILLTGAHTPGFIADVDEDVISTFISNISQVCSV